MHAHQQQQSKDDPVVIRVYYVNEAASRQPSGDGHDCLRAAEGSGDPQDLSQGDTFTRTTYTDGDGKTVHRETDSH
jgi:hypothetical protein